MVRVQFRSVQRSIQCASLCQIQMFYLLRGSNPVLCVSLHQFRKAQRSNPMCFAVPNSKCVIFSRDQVQYYVPLCTNSVALPFQRIKPRIMCFFAPTQMFYLLKGSNPILCVSLHQVSFNCFMLVELHQSLVAFLQMFVPAELHQGLVTLLLLPAQVVVAVFHQ